MKRERESFNDQESAVTDIQSGEHHQPHESQLTLALGPGAQEN